ncbi:MAG: helix-turn-helix domain-containing protein [Pseudomonadales bacterium]
MKKTATYRPLRTSADLSGTAIRVHRQDPPPDLAPYVYEFCQYDVDPSEDYVPVQVYPNGCLSLRFNVRPDGVESVLYGPCLSNRMTGFFFHEWVIFSAALYPQRAYHLLGISVQELRDLRIHMDLLWPNQMRFVEEAMLEAWSFDQRIEVFTAFLRRMIRRDVAPHAEFLNVFNDLASGAPTASDLGLIARQYGTNGRSLRRQFAKYLGLGPKQMDRVMRIQRCMRAIAGTPQLALANLALSAGFSDQAHFSREFKSLVGCTPRTYASRIGRMHDKTLETWTGMNPNLRHTIPPPLVRFT